MNGEALWHMDGDTLLRMAKLLSDPGIVLIPIGALAAVVLVLGIERGFGLRTSRLLPDRLADELRRCGRKGAVDPRPLWQSSTQQQSAAGRIMQAMLLKTGRPIAEVQQALAAAEKSEAHTLAANLRRLSLAAAAAALIGLLGTIAGLIAVFLTAARAATPEHATLLLARPLGMSLLPMFGGLAVMLPAVTLVHMGKNRIAACLHEVDRLARDLLPHLERFEQRVQTCCDASGELKLEFPAPPGG